MERFELRVVHAWIGIGDAIEDVIDSGKSGLLIRCRVRTLKVVYYDDLVTALNRGHKTVLEAASHPVLDLESIIASHDDGVVDNVLRSEGATIAFLGESGGIAQLFSTSEGIGGPLAAASAGVRCSRPGRPPATPPRSWYHYYPPNQPDPINPYQCKFCSGTLP